ncbi:hypothetical protein CCAX7_17620 [Capsulimonas corticalis]|uniref:Malectin domain-containing protein n=1 Tax=Capsulimonas corticalis TaxID=2219043 RepID=A0A402D3R9_9BACT|nr:malectin domain-containing carbohydrate-binding protein [Capsulimonas corticalis]BDI29711.1 hypothetical protein CCAX7_17620 [Capsulimonas corticalis]
MTIRTSRWRQVFPAFALLAAAQAHGAAAPPIILTPPNPTRLETLAAHEALRYVYLRTGSLASVGAQEPSSGGNAIVIAPKNSPILRQAMRDSATRGAILALKPEQYLLKTITSAHGGRVLVIAGGGDIGALYGVYRFAERLGVRFYLQGDTVPDRKIAWSIPTLNETGKPLFAIRGIQPFHDFPEGPDWWSKDDYLTYISQLAKMRMNFLGLHAYPEGGPNAEPLVWLGQTKDVDAQGRASFAYPASWYTNSRETWGYSAARTKEFSGGAGALFDADIYGSDVMRGLDPWTQTPAQSVQLFHQTGDLLHDVFAEAKALGVKTCIGTETPMIAPSALQERLRAEGMDPGNPKVKRDLYEGAFRRIAARYPVDYYWLWTPEDWTWNGNTPAQFAKTTDDIQAAEDALTALGKPFQLATCGWVLGPQNDRTALDRFLPKDVPMSSINRSTGNDPVDAGYARIKDRPTWAIPWLENDPQLTGAQPWVGRMMYDAADARRLGCAGLIGIHWRTQEIAANVSALADAAWDQSYAKPSLFRAPNGQTEGVLGGRTIVSAEAVAGANPPAVYQSVRYNVDGYFLHVLNGAYTVTLKFNEPHYSEAGKRVFGVQLQGKQVLEHLDIFARAGRNHALDFDYPKILVTDGCLKIAFTREVEMPAIAGIVVQSTAAPNHPGGAGFVRRINCGGPAVAGYETDLAPVPARDDHRTAPTLAFYTDFARANFGPEIAASAGKILSKVDGMNMPKPIGWLDGPGNVAPDRQPWKLIETRYAFVDQFSALRPQIIGAGNRERFDFWRNSYRAARAMQIAGCVRGALDAAMESLKSNADPKKKKTLAAQALDLRIQLARAWDQVIALEEATVNTPGALGTIDNLETHTLRHAHFLDIHDADLAAALGRALPGSIRPSASYRGSARIIVPTLRGQAAPGERLHVRVILLGGVQNGALYWRRLGRGAFQRIPLAHVARSVYEAALPPAPSAAPALEYYVQSGAGATALRFPATAPALNQTVVIAKL